MKTFEDLLNEERIFCVSGHNISAALKYGKSQNYFRRYVVDDDWVEKDTNTYDQCHSMKFEYRLSGKNNLKIHVGDRPRYIEAAEEMGITGLESYIQIEADGELRSRGETILKDLLRWLLNNNIPAITYRSSVPGIEAVNKSQ